jgi:RNA-directed DNA polymerase
MKTIRRCYYSGGLWPVPGKIALFNPDTMRTTRYRYRRAAIPAPGPAAARTITTAPITRLAESPVPG